MPCKLGANYLHCTLFASLVVYITSMLDCAINIIIETDRLMLKLQFEVQAKASQSVCCPIWRLRRWRGSGERKRGKQRN